MVGDIPIPDPGSGANEKEVLIITVNGKNVVWPPYLVVKKLDSVVFRGVNTSATVVLPKPGLFEEEEPEETKSGLAGLSFRVDKGKKKRIKVRKNAQLRDFPGRIKETANDYPVPGIYPYAVYCEDGNDFAVGNSSPVIIIEPPEERP
jgi:hypothetical protein